MFSRQRIAFVLALTLAISVTTVCFVTLNPSAAFAPEPHVIKVLRRKDKKQLPPTAAEIAAFHLQEKEERQLEDDIPKHLPIKFKLKADKEKKFKDLNNPTWYRDFELEVTNTSDKPIYFLLLWLECPEIDAAPGFPLAIPLQYGRMNFIEQETRPIPTDIPLQPGETYVFTIPERDRKGWEAHKQRDGIRDPKRTLLTFVHLSFGDGTGFATTGAKPYPFTKQSSLAPFCRSGPTTTAVVQGER